MTDPAILELLLRGAAAGILLLAATHFFLGSKGLSVERLGALFLLGTSAYTIISSPVFSALPHLVWVTLIAVATINSVLFWWFATSLFDDTFRWTWWRFAPLGLLAAIFLYRRFSGDGLPGPIDTAVQQVIVIAMILHVLWLALAHRGDDLVERRRAFRLVFAALAGLLGLVIAVSELVLAGGPAPQSLLLAHSGALFCLSLGLTVWVLPKPEPLKPQAAGAVGADKDVPPSSKTELARLERAMEERAYVEDGLTIAALANRLAVPEYRLRKLINGELGYDNFRSFLNSYRLRDARKILSDPANARLQITQVALDLGYGSVGPFNRAFKMDTGLTPTEFRKKTLAET